MKWITNAEVNSDDKSVTSWMLFGMLTQRAKYLGPYRGCALVGKEPHGPEPLRRRVPINDAQHLWPEGQRVDLATDEDAAELAVSLDVAFEPYKARESNASSYNTRAFVVVQNGRIVYEYQAPGFTTSMPLLGWSMTKTLMASLIGIRIGEGAMSLDSKVSRWFQDWKTTHGGNKSDITIDALLTMQSGLLWSEGYQVFQGDVIPMIMGDESCSERPRRMGAYAEHGKSFYYASGTTNLLSEILRLSVKYDEAYWTYPARMLFDPIGAETMTMETDRVGTFNAAAFSYASARDWARFGLLYLRDGVWIDGKRILPEGWVEYATARRDSSKGIYGANFWLGGSTAETETIEHDHTLLFHGINSKMLHHTTFTTTGFKGQFVAVVPEKNAVIVRLALDPSRMDYGCIVSDITRVLP